MISPNTSRLSCRLANHSFAAQAHFRNDRKFGRSVDQNFSRLRLGGALPPRYLRCFTTSESPASASHSLLSSGSPNAMTASPDAILNSLFPPAATITYSFPPIL